MIFSRRSGAWKGTDELAERLAALFVVLALAGCAQGTSGQAGAQYPPYPPDNNGNTPEHGVGGGSGM
jgi:hypothetical protein